MGLAFILFLMAKGLCRPILALVSHFEQFYPLSSGLTRGMKTAQMAIAESVFSHESAKIKAAKAEAEEAFVDLNLHLAVLERPYLCSSVNV